MKNYLKIYGKKSAIVWKKNLIPNPSTIKKFWKLKQSNGDGAADF